MTQLVSITELRKRIKRINKKFSTKLYIQTSFGGRGYVIKSHKNKNLEFSGLTNECWSLLNILALSLNNEIF